MKQASMVLRLVGRCHHPQLPWVLQNLSIPVCQPSQSFHVVVPGNVSPERHVPSHIRRPSYAEKKFFKLPRFPFGYSIINSDKELNYMRDSCRLARDILQAAGEFITEGITTDMIDRFVHEMAIENNAYPSPLGYKNFPKSVCTSVNNVCCHGIPDDRPLCIGDIINVDVTVYLNGYHGDTSAMFLIGDVDEEARCLVNTTRSCLEKGIEVCGPGTPLDMIGNTIQNVYEAVGFEVVPEFCGHGVGKYFHMVPDILHMARTNHHKIMKMQEGMIFTIEPVLIEGSPEFRILKDGWTAVSLDNSRSAQFEHTIRITPHGHEILTL